MIASKTPRTMALVLTAVALVLGLIGANIKDVRPELGVPLVVASLILFIMAGIYNAAALVIQNQEVLAAKLDALQPKHTDQPQA